MPYDPDMRAALSITQLDAEAEFEDFVRREVVPAADRLDATEQMCLTLLQRVAAAGYFGLTLPDAYGGRGQDMVTYGLLHRQIGMAWASLRNILTVHTMVAHALWRWGDEKLKSSLLGGFASGEVLAAFCLSESQAGSAMQSIETTAKRCNGGFILNGTKKWTTAGEIAGIYLVFVLCEGEYCAFLVDRGTQGISIKPVRGMLGTRASMLADISFVNCFVPGDRMVGAPGFGLSCIANTALDLGRYSVACGCAGIAKACVTASLQYASERQQFGVPIREHQLVQKMLTEAAANSHAAWLVCHHAGSLRDQGHPDAIRETAVAKYFAAKVAVQAASDAVQIHGANGCSADFPVNRYYRDAKIMEIIEGSSQILETLIAKML